MLTALLLTGGPEWRAFTQGGALQSVTPLGASPGVQVFVIGTGFNTTAGNNLVTFTPDSGTAVTVAASAITTLDAARDRRRLTVFVPQGLPPQTTALKVTNSATGNVSAGVSIDVLHLASPTPASAARGIAGLTITISASSNTNFVAGRTVVNLGSGVSTRSVQVISTTSATATVDISASAPLGTRTLIVQTTNQSLLLQKAFTITDVASNQPPTANANGPYSAPEDQPIAFTSKGSTDPDGDTLTYAWTFGDGGTSTDANPTHTYTAPGVFDVSLTVSDGKGGSATATTTANVAPAVSLTRIDVDPPAIRFSALDATRALSVIGTRSDNSTTNLTAAAAGTTYGSSNPFVASVSADGLVTARANGETVVTATNGTFSDTVAVVVESGVTLDALQLTPATTTLKAPGASQALTLKGTFSDGSVRDLTTAAGTTYASHAGTIASVSPAGLVTAASNGRTDITATHADRSAAAEIIVAIPEGRGFVRGAVFDDSRGLPLAGATVTLLSDGGGGVDTAVSALTDETGRYALPARGGDALLRIQKSGFTTVDRTVAVPASAIARALDARLTPIDPHSNPLQSVFGGLARDAASAVTLTLPAGSLLTDTDVRLTTISAQGLAARIPLGWSPIAGVEISPATAMFAQTATLLLANTGGAAAGATVTIARYDRDVRAWMAFATAPVSQDGRSISIGVTSGGQYAALLPDAPPFTPPAQVNGRLLTGVDAVAVSDGVTADGDTVPRAASPGDGARAVGRIGVGGVASLPSGTAMQVHVNETFELLDSSKVIPLPFTQDILVHARPRPPNGGTLGATFPITPSRSYTIQELMRGVVRVDVTRPSTQIAGAQAGPQGTIVTDLDGDSLTVPAGALAGETVVDLRRMAPIANLPATFIPIQSFAVDIIGASFVLPGRLSTAIPAGITATDQILLIQTFVDPLGIRRVRIAGIGHIAGDRLVSDHVLGTLTFSGVSAGGEYSFVKSAEPIGFVTGNISGADGSTPAPLALVTSSTTAFVDVTGSTGRYVVAARAAADATIAARHLLSSDTASGTANPSARDAIVVLSLTLAVAPPSVVAASPSAGTLNVALDTSIVIDFSEAIDPASITDASVTLQTGGAGVSISRTLSQDRRRLTVRPLSPLLGKTTYVLSLTSQVEDLSGAALVPFPPLSFTTLDPTKPPQPPPGQIVAELPDEDGVTVVTASAGSAEAGTAVTATNIRTQETFTVLAGTDGSFRLRIGALIGDEIVLTLRDALSRETTISITQFDGADGSASVGAAGGLFRDANGRLGTVLPRALVRPGVFKFGVPAALPAIPLGGALSYVDRFTLSIDGAEFNRVASLTLTESQGRFPPASALASPFESVGQLTVPADFLLNSALRYTATVQDTSGVRRSVAGTTAVVATNPDVTEAETAQPAVFPTLFLSAPQQAVQNQIVIARAVAPAARIDLRVAAPAAAIQTVFLARVVDLAGAPRLSVVDVMTATGDGQMLQTSGRGLPGMTAAGEYAVVGSTEPLVLITGQLVGSAGIVAVDGLPFVVETGGPNGRFAIPSRANQPFTLQFFEMDGSLRGTTSGQAPTAGTIDIGDPLGVSVGQLTVSVQPDQTRVVDIGQPVVMRFSEAVDLSTLPAGLIVTDADGARVYGRFSSLDAGRTVEFRPMRRWRYATRYRFGLRTSVLALSGARLSQPLNGEFITFAPSLLGAVPIGQAHEVAVSGSLAVAGTENSARVLDVTSPLAPQVLSAFSLMGGVRGIALLPSSTLSDRNGQNVSGTFAAVVSGDAATGGRLSVLDLGAQGAPVLLGTAQLTAVPGQTPPVGVPDASGTPVQVVVTPDHRALVAVEDVGLVSVRLGQVIPNDPANPGGAIGPRYPSSGTESIAGVALLGDRVVTAGAGGLTVLDAITLQRRGGLSTGSSLRSVSVVPSFAMDVNGDGIPAATEVFDLAVATGGTDGTVQLFVVPQQGDPTLLAVVRPAAETTGVRLSAEERLAYVGLGIYGVSVVDLDGPASVQPIDLDRNGLDDRVLASLAMPGSVNAIALQLSRGVGYAASGSSGVTALQLAPSRAVFESVVRDPVRAMTGDEQPVGDSRTAFASDDALQVTVGAVTSPRDQLVLTIEETTQDGGTPVLTYPGGATGAPLQSGANTLIINVAAETVNRRSRATLRVQTSTGLTLSTFDMTVEPHATAGAALDSLIIAPATASLPSGADTVQLGVAGVFESGLVLNLTRAETGSAYFSESVDVATVGADALVTAAAGGATRVMATNSGRAAFTQITVPRPPRLVALSASAERATLRTTAQPQDLGFVGRFSDGTFLAAADIAGTTFRSSDPAIATVDAAGLVTAVAAGDTTIVAENGTLSVEVAVTNDFRTPASISAIELRPIPSPVPADEGRVVATAVLAGTGSLDGFAVSFTASGVVAATSAATSDLSGAAVVEFGPLTSAGSLTISASVADPSTGQTRSASQTITVGAPTGDAEPNDTPATASVLGAQRTANGSIDAGSDARDTYRLSASSDGTIDVTIDVSAVPQSSLMLVVRNANGEELARIALSPGATVQSIQVPAGAATISVEALTGSATYRLSFKFQQATPTIAAVSPLSGPAATLVTITGTGYSVAPEAVMVLFNGVAGKLIAVTPTTISVQVPANAPNGPLEVISGSRQVTGPVFTTGLAAEPPDFFVPPQPAFIRRLPDGRTPLIINRLLVSFDPTLARPGVEAIVQQAGGVVVGFDADDNSYIIEFPNNTSLDFLYQRRRLLEANASVVLVTLDSLYEADSSRRIDMRDYSGSYATAHDQIRLFQAVTAVRRSRLETDAFPTVRVAVLDDGVRVVSGGELDGVVIAEGPTPGTGDHGTPVAGVIGALNDNNNYSGVLNSVKFANESPFAVHAFTVQFEPTNFFYKASIKAALKRIKARNRDGNSLNDIDVINMSFGGFSNGAEMERERRFWAARLKPIEARTLVAASAGNEGFVSFVAGITGHFPSAMAFAAPPGGVPLTNVLSVGATATMLSANGTTDQRAVFSEPLRATFPCAGIFTVQTRTRESNCDPGMSIVAPGKEVPTVRKNGAPAYFQGTSASSPLVAGIAALVQASRPDFFARISPERLATILQLTSDDISEIFEPVGPGGSLRLNALAAVRAVLPAPPAPKVYIADTDSNVVVALSADPVTGVVGQTAEHIALSVSRPDFAMTATNPTTLAVSPAGDRLYVAAESEFGHFGVMVINTDTHKAANFITLYEAGCGPGQTPMIVRTLRPGMAFSKDGRLLYVTNGDRLVVINTDTEEQVHRFERLPVPYSATADTQNDELACRLEQIRTLATSGQLGLTGTALGALEVSPDARILYIAMQAGRGAGSQPGAIIPIDIDLYRDATPAIVGLQPDLSTFLKPAFAASNVKGFTMPPDPPDVVVELANAVKGDEPSDVAVSPDGRFVYLVNGGVQAYSGAIPDDEALRAAIITALGGLLVGSAVAATGNLYAAAVGTALGATLMSSALVHDILPEMVRTSRELGVVVAAPGITAAFDTKSNPPGDVPWFYTSTTAFAWVTGNDREGFNANQRSFDQVFASRPFGMAMKPDGSRAIVSLFQTGNFAVVDESTQSFFKNVNSEFSQAPAGVFQGFAAVTPAIRFDQFLWPENPLDDRLLYPTAVEYAQNGRFAVGVHTGVADGAVTVLDDEAITRDLIAHTGTLAPGFQRSYFAQVPLCKTLDTSNFRCNQEVFTRLFDYNASGGTSTFKRPRGVAIDPFVVVEAPRFGDFVTLGSAIHVRWRSTAGSAVSRVVFEVEDLGPASAPTPPTSVGAPVPLTPNPLEALSQSLKAGLVAIFGGNAGAPQDGHRYRIKVRVVLGSGDTLSRTSVEVTYVDQ